MRVMVLTDGKRIPITEREEILISTALDDGNDRVTVKSVPYKKTLIGYFDDPTQDEVDAARIVDVWSDSKVLLQPGNKCKGTMSIQREINNRAKALHRKEDPNNMEAVDWAKLTTDRDWREMMREIIHNEDPETIWCDHKLGSCVCYANNQT